GGGGGGQCPRPFGHIASSEATAGGPSCALTQCEPPAEQQAGSVLGSITGGPMCGHMGAAPPSEPLVPPEPPPPPEHLPSSQAPVGLLSRGLMQGAQRSSGAQLAWGSRPWLAMTWGMHRLRHTPGPPIDWHDGGV